MTVRGGKLACRHALPLSFSLPANPVTADHSDGARVQQPCRFSPGEEETRAGTDRGGSKRKEPPVCFPVWFLTCVCVRAALIVMLCERVRFFRVPDCVVVRQPGRRCISNRKC